MITCIMRRGVPQIFVKVDFNRDFCLKYKAAAHYSHSACDTGDVVATFSEKAELDQFFLRKVAATSPMKGYSVRPPLRNIHKMMF